MCFEKTYHWSAAVAQELVCLRGAQEHQLHRARRRGELPGASGGGLPALHDQLPPSSDVSSAMDANED